MALYSRTIWIGVQHTKKIQKKSYKQRSEELEIVCKVLDNMEWSLSQSDGESATTC